VVAVAVGLPSYTFNYPPMSLAMNSRDVTGAYRIGSFTH
jgi:hypothetical protein